MCSKETHGGLSQASAEGKSDKRVVSKRDNIQTHGGMSQAGAEGRPPESALSARLSSRHILINPDLAGTFQENSRVTFVAKNYFIISRITNVAKHF